jgi:hypothetical protein
MGGKAMGPRIGCRSSTPMIPNPMSWWLIRIQVPSRRSMPARTRTRSEAW